MPRSKEASTTASAGLGLFRELFGSQERVHEVPMGPKSACSLINELEDVSGIRHDDDFGKPLLSFSVP